MMSLVQGIARRHEDIQEARRASRGLVHRRALGTAPTVAAERGGWSQLGLRCALGVSRGPYARSHERDQRQPVRGNTWQPKIAFAGESVQQSLQPFSICRGIQNIERNTDLTGSSRA
jgi:hypothetical protein